MIDKEKIRHQLEDFCASTSIHGIKYVGERGRPFFERLWWLFVCLLGFATSLYYISYVYSKFLRTPIIVAFDETPTPIWDVPFPAVTICNEAKALKSAFDFADFNNTLNEPLDDFNQTLRNQNGFLTYTCSQAETWYNFTQNVTQDMEDLYPIIESAPSVDDTVMMIVWQNKLVQTAKSGWVNHIYTDEGLCHTFNQLNHKDVLKRKSSIFLYDMGYFNENISRIHDWTLDSGYSPQTPVHESYPRRIKHAGVHGGLGIVMYSRDENFQPECRLEKGFKIKLHHPADIPNVMDSFIYIPPDQMVMLTVKPNVMIIDENVKEFDTNTRQCYLESERFLKHFKRYTQANCELECLRNFTFEKCGCVPGFMPKTADEPYCAAGKRECVLDARDDLRILQTQHQNASCNCLPGCTSTQYDVETSQTVFSWDAVTKKAKRNKESGGVLSRVNVMFKTKEFTTSKRKELFGKMELIANCGGLLGLFCGMSLLGIMEVLYFASFRWWTTSKIPLHRNRRQKDLQD